MKQFSNLRSELVKFFPDKESNINQVFDTFLADKHKAVQNVYKAGAGGAKAESKGSDNMRQSGGKGAKTSNKFPVTK